MRNPTTIRLGKPLLIHSHHYLPGDAVTIDDDVAGKLIRDGLAVRVALDLSRVPEPPRKRDYMRTTSLDPVESRAARIAGRAR
jgi:hypothetical protein